MRAVGGVRKLILAAAMLAAIAVAPSAVAQEKAPDYVLSAAERAMLREKIGTPTDRILANNHPVDHALERVFWFVAEPYDDTISYDRRMGQTLLGHFVLQETYADEPPRGSPIVLDQDRFVAGAMPRCRAYCRGWAAFVADLKTGHVVVALVDPDIDRGSREQSALLVFSVACVDPELREAARPLIDRLAGSMLRRTIQWTPVPPVGRRPDMKAKKVTVSCDGKLVEPLPKPSAPAAASKNPVAKAWAYPLTAKETAVLRSLVGEDSLSVLRNKKVGKRLDQVFRVVADGVEVGPRYTFYRLFNEQIAGPPDPAELVEDRFLFVHGCAAHACDSKSAFIVDLVSGHLAMSTLAVGGEDPDSFRIVGKACANDELKAAAARRFAAWAEAMQVRQNARVPTPPPVVTSTPCR